MTWFSDLTGIAIETPQSVRDLLSVEGTTLVSTATARRAEIGTLTTPSLAELRAETLPENGPATLTECVADIQFLHRDPNHAGALFQVASQFNLLEMIAPSVRPEDGVTRYADDPTQGPACAVACGAGTIYRTYFHPVRGGLGQSADRQIDCLADIGAALNNDQNGYWVMQNGYALSTAGGLAALNNVLAPMSDVQLDALRAKLRVGIQEGTEVTLAGAGHCVTQVYCSALPVAYSPHGHDHWQAFAKLVLEAAYEATMLSAVKNAQHTGNNRVFLTMLGGGAFGNKNAWIVDAMLRALRMVRSVDLDISIVSYGQSSPAAREVIDRFNG
ncbi:hypothetical protein V8J82_18950 [Gymnodinialimonas sp. 2305UL16-5]|uniref:hypothetical protein n=1 Tax=Gymnodinialimonas mytili TaxID=3126503 RepID=UPI0030B78C90